MTTISNTPINLNPLGANGYKFSIDKIPGIQYFCQEIALPAISLGEATQATPFSQIALPGDQVTYDPLNIDFLIDTQMANYTAIHNWIIGLGFPIDHSQYSTFIKANSQTGLTNNAKAYSDGLLQILDGFNSPVRTIQFVDMVPQSLEALTFTSTSQDVVYLVGRATFRYTYYKFI
jgi:hypothetical protein